MRLSTTVAGIVAAASLFAVVLPAASASASPRGTCVGGRVCLYASYDYNRGQADRWRDFTADDQNLTDNNWLNWDYSNTWHSMDNETSSFRNRIGCNTTLWQHPNFTGAHNTFLANENDGFLFDNSVGNNAVSSIDILCR